MVRCPGCNTECKGGKGLTLHLRLTTNEACHAIFSAAETHIGPLIPAAHLQQPLQADDSDIEQFGEAHKYGLPVNDGAFHGDFFGDDYMEEDFGYKSDEGESPEDSDPEKLG
ncbi:hypothetical protein C8J57DRAFT_1514210 [Mycena rebaudengoi]|nr:hypothetical protein C8J57DRAFT_1514210 [Mycena rebaudengoi]